MAMHQICVILIRHALSRHDARYDDLLVRWPGAALVATVAELHQLSALLALEALQPLVRLPGAALVVTMA